MRESAKRPAVLGGGLGGTKQRPYSERVDRARQADKPNVGEGLQTLAPNHRRGLKTPTYEAKGWGAQPCAPTDMPSKAADFSARGGSAFGGSPRGASTWRRGPPPRPSGPAPPPCLRWAARA